MATVQATPNAGNIDVQCGVVVMQEKGKAEGGAKDFWEESSVGLNAGVATVKVDGATTTKAGTKQVDFSLVDGASALLASATALYAMASYTY